MKALHSAPKPGTPLSDREVIAEVIAGRTGL